MAPRLCGARFKMKPIRLFTDQNTNTRTQQRVDINKISTQTMRASTNVVGMVVAVQRCVPLHASERGLRVSILAGGHVLPKQFQ